MDLYKEYREGGGEANNNDNNINNDNNNKTSKTDVAPWCYKWVGGLDGYLRVGICIEHLMVLIMQQAKHHKL